MVHTVSSVSNHTAASSTHNFTYVYSKATLMYITGKHRTLHMVISSGIWRIAAVGPLNYAFRHRSLTMYTSTLCSVKRFEISAILRLVGVIIRAQNLVTHLVVDRLRTFHAVLVEIEICMCKIQPHAGANVKESLGLLHVHSPAVSPRDRAA